MLAGESFKIPDGQSKKDEIARLEHLGPVVDSVIKISDDLDTIERLQHHMRVREQVHRDGTPLVRVCVACCTNAPCRSGLHQLQSAVALHSRVRSDGHGGLLADAIHSKLVLGQGSQ